MVINEETTFNLTVKPFDQNRVALTPTTARYKVDCLTNGRSIRGWTTLTASASMSIPIVSADNVILTDGSRVERRQLQVQTDFGTSTQNVFAYEWDVRNLA